MKFRLDRPTAMYNAGLWFVAGGVLSGVALVVGGSLPSVAWGAGALGLLTVIVAIALLVRPPWVVRIDDRLTVRGRHRVSVPLTEIRDVRWVAGQLVVRSTAGQVRIPPVESRTKLAESLRDRLEHL